MQKTNEDTNFTMAEPIRPLGWYRLSYPSGFYTWIYLNKQEAEQRRRELEI